ncbi:uncharacterized protein BYT42DRAFT_578393 [Radiomyces spectabilis]|uniref:uncharacterized protein n=1 Tax=Radiomyces spectabilis TaxID=64574 RepID=UPI00221FBB89|nr:uncharacterized protein BYT42DRAFT_578393 [Radiomyces spectabilis]KAI8372900.1 hypothetical protein BYT42DRAFT_578393 [Radiomyces spectabilis]
MRDLSNRLRRPTRNGTFDKSQKPATKMVRTRWPVEEQIVLLLGWDMDTVPIGMIGWASYR